MTNDDLDACLRLVADHHRRRILQRLQREAHGATGFGDLVDELSDSRPGPDDESPDRERLAIQLQHTHLPKLADYGVVEYDRRSGAVRYQPDPLLEMVLDSLPEEVSPLNP